MSEAGQAAYDHGYADGRFAGVLVVCDRVSALATEAKDEGDLFSAAALMKLADRLLDELARSRS